MSQSEFSDPFLRERYGIKSSRLPSWVIPGVITALIGGGWLLWSANHYSKPEIRATLISFQALSDSKMQIRYSVTFRSPQKAHRCQLVARDYSANVVGEVSDLIPAGVSTATRVIAIPTRLKAVNAAILGCQA